VRVVRARVVSVKARVVSVKARVVRGGGQNREVKNESP